MGIARLTASAFSTHLDKERTTRTGENARRGDTAFKRGIYQNTNAERETSAISTLKTLMLFINSNAKVTFKYLYYLL